MSPLPSIGSKQRGDQRQWAKAWRQIMLSPDFSLAERMIGRAVTEIRRTVNGKRAAYGWAGGKDSLALEIVAREAGVDKAMMGLSSLEWPSFVDWAGDNAPPDLTVEIVEEVDYVWLQHRPNLLFPSSSASAGKWFTAVQHEAQRRFCKREGVEVLLLGRRRADGNFVGRGSDRYTARDGVVRYSPLASWTHAELLNVLAVRGVSLPSLYSWPRGFLVGTGPWPSRRSTGSAKKDWDECWDIDPQVVHEASRNGIPGAKETVQRWT